MTNLRLAQVVAVHPQRGTVELVYLDDGARAGEAAVMGNVSGDGGTWTVPNVERPPSEQQAGRIQTGGRRTMMAVVANIYGRPVVLGFLSPDRGQMAFTEQNVAVFRHPSGAVVSIGPDGTLDVRHPAGAALRIGTGPSEPLAGAVNGWSPPSAGGTADLTITTGGVTMAIKAGGTIDLTCDKLTVTGDIEAQGDVKAGSISLKTHKHGGVQAGAAQTGAPV